MASLRKPRRLSAVLAAASALVLITAASGGGMNSKDEAERGPMDTPLFPRSYSLSPSNDPSAEISASRPTYETSSAPTGPPTSLPSKWPAREPIEGGTSRSGMGTPAHWVESNDGDVATSPASSVAAGDPTAAPGRARGATVAALIALEIVGIASLMSDETASTFEEVAVAFVNDRALGGAELSSFVVVNQTVVPAGTEYMSARHEHWRRRRRRRNEEEARGAALRVEGNATGAVRSSQLRLEDAVEDAFASNMFSFLRQLAAADPFFSDGVAARTGTDSASVVDAGGGWDGGPTVAPTAGARTASSLATEAAARDGAASSVDERVIISGVATGSGLAGLILAVGLALRRRPAVRRKGGEEARGEEAEAKEEDGGGDGNSDPIQHSRNMPEGLEYSLSDLASHISSLSDLHGDWWSYVSAELDPLPDGESLGPSAGHGGPTARAVRPRASFSSASASAAAAPFDSYESAVASMQLSGPPLADAIPSVANDLPPIRTIPSIETGSFDVNALPWATDAKTEGEGAEGRDIGAAGKGTESTLFEF